MENFHWDEYWDFIKNSLRKTYTILKEEDLQYSEGDESILMERLASKLGITSSEINEVLFLHLICAEQKKESENDLAAFAADLMSLYYFPN